MQGHDIQSGWASRFPLHPIFKISEETRNDGRLAVEDIPPTNQASLPRRTSRMCFRGSDIILAVGKELRIAPLIDYRGSSSSSTAERPYKTLHTPNIQFDIQQIALCPGGKMIAVAGAHQIAVVVLPRPSYYKLVNSRVDAKSIQIGQFHHAISGSSQIAKVDWHPWHDGGSSLLVLTADGVLREYDVSRDAEEPQQTLSFVPDRVGGKFSVEDPASLEAVSFCIGKGMADWSPLTVFSLMRNGDVWAMSPFLPATASVPSSYIPALECFVAAKRELIEANTSAFMSASTSSLDPAASTAESLAIINDHQTKFVNALNKQLAMTRSRNHRSLSFDVMDRSESPGPPKAPARVTIRLPAAQRRPPARQGPFLLQPSPPELEGSLKYDDEFENEATDIAYIGPGQSSVDGLTADLSPEEKEDTESSEPLGVIAITWRDGRVDLCLDAEKVEAKWEFVSASSKRQSPGPQDLPTLTVFESVDLGILKTLEVDDPVAPTSALKLSKTPPQTISLIRSNHPLLYADPLYPGKGRLFVSHSFGVHLIDTSGWMSSISKAIKADDELEHQDGRDDRLIAAVTNAPESEVSHLLSSFSIEQRSTTPIVSVGVLDNSAVNYSLIALTAQYQAVPITLTLRPLEEESQDVLLSPVTPSKSDPKIPLFSPQSVVSAYISLLTKQPFVVPTFRSQRAMVSITPPRGPTSPTQIITPETLRMLGKHVEGFRSDMRDVTSAVGALQDRIALQKKEMERQLSKLVELVGFIDTLKPAAGLSSPFDASSTSEDRVEKVVATQRSLLIRLDRVLQRLMDSYSPKLSEFETKWFAELGRMDREINGGKGVDDDVEGRSMKSRATLARNF
ncbi:uncharacterized protein EI90DRAFT_3134078 [Cantharellus anzutake]|uniref:uncharacterized protein n=1 Tax=Cantharellus anzutake TaxID=1750568 RepID=UPI001908066E|nr:uncharacterized protein EI90DRAFT_3134078 [Cantharellus anzutake]KAF8317032.1 hypothetical protein EI90DRAFT_3134078 [Cantharellus anzutake]